MNIQQKGIEETVEHFAAMQRNFTANSIGQFVDIALQQVQDEAQANCPVVTGRLRASIQHQMQSPVSGICYANAPYAAAVEFGYQAKSGARIPGRNFFRPAAQHGRVALIKMLRDFVAQNKTLAGAKSAGAGARRGGRTGGAHKFQYKVNTGAGTKYYYGKKRTTITRRTVVLHPGPRKQKGGGRRFRGGRRTGR